MRIPIIILFLTAVLVSSCEKTPQNNNQPPLIEKGKGVFIVNEGRYGSGEASVSYYRADSNTVYDDIFYTINHRHLGDICQSMYIFNGKAYIIVNNSRKIEVVDVNTFQSIATISGLTSPRYFLPVSQTKAYVSDMYSNSVSVIDLNTNMKTGEIPCQGSTEEMLAVNNKVYIANTEKEYIYIADPATDMITDSIHLSYGPLSMVKDKAGKLWVLCMGNYLDNTKAALFKLNSDGNGVELKLFFTSYLNAWNKLKINRTEDTLYFINGQVFRMATSSTGLPTDPFIVINSSNFYGLGVDDKTGNIYISDAIDYSQKGKIYIFTSRGILLNSFNAGIIPGGFYFY